MRVQLTRHNRANPTSVPLAVALAALIFGVLLCLRLDVWQILPLAVLLGVTGQRLVSVVVGDRGDLFAPPSFVALYFLVSFGVRAIYVLTSPAAHPWGLNPTTTSYPKRCGARLVRMCF